MSATADPDHDPLVRLKTLAPRERLSLGVMYGQAPADFALMMAIAAHAFASDRSYTEAGVNDVLREFLAGAGAMLAVDQVELRRWLVDTGVLARDGFGRAYRRGEARADIAAVVAATAGHDLAALVRTARADEAQRREARKAAWVRRPAGA